MWCVLSEHFEFYQFSVLSILVYGEAIPIRGGELIAISVLKVLEFFLNCHATINFPRNSVRLSGFFSLLFLFHLAL
jgi:hypothetical protein